MPSDGSRPQLAICGCGGMGRRHIRGIEKLRAAGIATFDLVALCDPFEPNAQLARELAEATLDCSPGMFTSFAAIHEALPELDAVLITTAPDYHVPLGIQALRSGVHVLVEKPIALTVREGLQLVRAAEETGRCLAVAENYRRDPVNRFARALLDAGAIGQPFLMLQASSGSGERVIITPWRHLKRSGGIVVDMGIHYADLLEYFLGPIDALAGMGAVVDRQRVDENDVRHPADAEDLCLGLARFRSGAMGNLILSLAGRGESLWNRTIYGTGGSLAIPPDRSGRPLKLVQRSSGHDIELEPAELLELLPDWTLDATTAALFGGPRAATYEMPFGDIDANLLAIEMDDFAAAIREGRPAEVSGQDGLRSLAAVYGWLESDALGRFIGMDELLSEQHFPYQQALHAVAEAGT